MPEVLNSRDGGGGRRVRFVVGFLIILAAIGVLVARGARNSMVYYITVSELLAKDRGADLRGLRVTGKVVEGSIDRKDFNLSFQMTDGSGAVPVSYSGVIPDTFGEKGEVVVEGRMGPEGVFEANFLMAKCPSKYEMSPDGEKGAMPASARGYGSGT